eukprot:jgi/Mesen1/3204/ME000185S02346
MRYRVTLRAAGISGHCVVFKDSRDVGFEIIVIDDNSPDGTQDVVRQLQRVYGKDTVELCDGSVVCVPCGQVAGRAYVHGLKHASGEFVIIMDADLSHHPEHGCVGAPPASPARVLRVLGGGHGCEGARRKQQETGADIVTGSRYIPGGGVHGWDLRRKMTSRGANVLSHTLLQPRVSDLTGSFRCTPPSPILLPPRTPHVETNASPSCCPP